MLISDPCAIGNKLYAVRKRMGMTQAEVAEKAGTSDRTYADIERGAVNMRVSTMLRICSVLHITPDEILTVSEPDDAVWEEDVLSRLGTCNSKDRSFALQLLAVYLKSLDG